MVEQLAAAGGSMKSIRHALKVSEDVFKRWLADSPDIAEAFDKGREAERVALHQKLYDMAINNAKGNMVAAMFLLKSRHGYREGEQGDAGSRVNITLNMPAAKPLDQYLIENGTDPARPAVQSLSISGHAGSRRA